MNTLKSLAAAAALATGLAGAAQAAPAFNAGIGNQPTTSAATPVNYGCVPVYRWVRGYYGWQQVYVGQRCPSYGYYGNPHYNQPRGTFRFNSPGLRIRIGF